MRRSRVPILVLMIALASKAAACGEAAELEAPPWTLEEPVASLEPIPVPADGLPLTAIAVRGALGLWSLHDGDGIVTVVETFKPLELRVELAAPLRTVQRVDVTSNVFATLPAAAVEVIDGGGALIVTLPDAARGAADLSWIRLEVTR